MSHAAQQLRRHAHPHGDISAWGGSRPRVSIIILGLTSVMGLVALAAIVLSHLVAAG